MIKFLKRHLGRQLNHPKGLFGLVIGRFMNNHNRLMYSDVYQLLKLSSNDNVLEIGFGNGAFVKELVTKIDPGEYCGIDISDTMISSATRKNSALIKSGKVKLSKANVILLPFKDQTFDKVFTLNTIYFWEDPQRVMLEIKRVLKPNGIFVVGLSTKQSMQDNDYFHEHFTLYEKEEVERLFTDFGFKILKTTYSALKFEDVLCIKGLVWANAP